ncbi:Uncharacterised protein [Anaerococcus prevotii]|uniref:Uncharacterized protein n=1 Tax=Anaerococcus prevotii (strain ATCC 9321 / DSM 20548 / JCM 6508 / NCTC 11806 / PC1) TaxID=525919 RepID=C7RH84_ANAPD|nr:hypothetical protein Apre_0817 [Anaerococcus prevotii DSM 20548]SUU94520.1 Uncharacterised protein [Anaerococcus prevotii]
MRIDSLKKIAEDCDYKVVDEEINITLERKNKPFNKSIRLLKTPEGGVYNRLTDEKKTIRIRKCWKLLRNFARRRSKSDKRYNGKTYRQSLFYPKRG